jgi:hypothetical protein
VRERDYRTSDVNALVHSCPFNSKVFSGTTPAGEMFVTLIRMAKASSRSTSIRCANLLNRYSVARNDRFKFFVGGMALSSKCFSKIRQGRALNRNTAARKVRFAQPDDLRYRADQRGRQ